MIACIITGIICFIVGAIVGVVLLALMIVAGDDSEEHEIHPTKRGNKNGIY